MAYYYKGKFNKDEEKKKLEIVRFGCRDGKYLIRSFINEKSPIDIPDETLDVLEN